MLFLASTPTAVFWTWGGVAGCLKHRVVEDTSVIDPADHRIVNDHSVAAVGVYQVVFNPSEEESKTGGVALDANGVGVDDVALGAGRPEGPGAYVAVVVDPVAARHAQRPDSIEVAVYDVGGGLGIAS